MSKIIVVSTENEKKFEEISSIFSNWESLQAKTLGIDVSAEVNGFKRDREVNGILNSDRLNSLKESRIKAISISNAMNNNEDFVVIADETRLEIESLNNWPGAIISNWDEITSGKNYNDTILESLKSKLKKQDRRATFYVTVTVIGKNFELSIEEKITGYISKTKRGTNGFGFDEIFEEEISGKTFAEMSPELKNKLSARRKAFAKVKAIIGVLD
ncbi:MAG: non-canonical purine NTP pyrophosphatase [Clostridia bacterium]|nr:non-canonical purine NTP pyrophosphatase [Clostridia bacterium]